jgi:hypothetical protein
MTDSGAQDIDPAMPEDPGSPSPLLDPAWRSARPAELPRARGGHD